MVRIESDHVTGVKMQARPIARCLVAAYLLAGLAVPAAAWMRGGPLGQPQVLVIAGLALAGAAALALLLAMMRDARPVVFFGVFFGLVVLPHFLAFGLFAQYLPQPAAPAPAAMIAAEVTADTPLQVTDLTRGILDARRALLSIYADGSQYLEIIYDGEAQARLRFLAEYQNQPPPLATLSGHSGVLSQEPGHVSFHAVEGRRLLKVTAADRGVLERRLLDSRQPAAAPSPPVETVAVAPAPALPLLPLLAGVLAYTVFVAWTFLRLSAWAATHAPAPDIPVLPASALRQRLLQLAGEDLPFTLKPGERPDELIAEWRHADATWLDLMRAHRLRRLLRFRLRLDEARAEVRVREFHASFDASAGHGGAGLRYQASWGISFFERHTEGVLGLQMHNGRPTRDPACVWRFDIEEMRRPLVALVTDAGWRWRPVMLDRL